MGGRPHRRMRWAALTIPSWGDAETSSQFGEHLPPPIGRQLSRWMEDTPVSACCLA